jgi:acetylornithine deacetylase/succinyl-diaminopimelate desuccinylase-like protein
MATFISKLEKLEMASDDYEVSTAEPTTCRTDPQSSNMIPGRCELTIDWRNIPGELEDQVMDKVKSLLPEGCNVSVAERQLRTYTNLLFNRRRYKPPFSIDKTYPLVKETTQAVRSVLKREVEVSRWPFSTDCHFFMEAGVPIVGFSPGEEKYIHTNKERISLHLMREAMACYPAIISSLSRLEKRKRLS